MADNLILDKLKGVQQRFEDVQQLITDPDVISDMKKYISLNKEYKNLEPISEAYKKYKEILENIAYSKEVLSEESDPEMREMAKEELDELVNSVGPLEAEIKILLLPEEPENEKNAVVEIRAGAGGDEASIFAGEVFRMYTKFAEEQKWKIDLTRTTDGTMGGYKEIVFEVSGKDVYGIMKYESGVHRVQRVPKTETQGRVHTSAASVTVLPEAGDFDVELKPADIRKDTYCSSGPGGQSVNTTYSAIRLTHEPSGIVVTCQDQKSQIKNLDKAMKELKTRLYNLEYQKYMDDLSSKRKTMVATGDRSAKVRTYNFPQGRMTDHRINYTMYNLPAIMDGNILEVIEKLQLAENAERLKESGF